MVKEHLAFLSYCIANNMNLNWWKKPKLVSILVDEDSWIVPFAKKAIADIEVNGDSVKLCYDYNDLYENGIVFIFSWQKILSKEILDKNYINLVVHASDLPAGRGFSPLTWQILEGRNEIPVCLFEARELLDTGPIIYKDIMHLKGHELISEIRSELGQLHIDFAKRYLSEAEQPEGKIQKGDSSIYQRRTPINSKLDPTKTIQEQFNLLRIVDNNNYPAFFELNDHVYKLEISKIK